MTMMSATPKIGLNKRMIWSSFSSLIILEKAAEYDIPMSMKFKTSLFKTTELKKKPTNEVNIIVAKIVIKVLVSLCLRFKIKPLKIPQTAPIIKGNITTKPIMTKDKPWPDRLLDTRVMVVKKTIQPTISSKAAIGIKDLVTGPSVLNSLTIDKAGAGAVARAIPPKIKPK